MGQAAVWLAEPTKLRTREKHIAVDLPEQRPHYVIIDPHTLSREGLSRLLADSFHNAKIEQRAAIPACGQAMPCADAILIVVAPGTLAVQNTLASFAPGGPVTMNAPVILLSDSWDLATVRQALSHGIRACVSLDLNFKIIAAALRLVIEGGTYVPPEILTCLDDGPRHTPVQVEGAPKPRAGPYFTPQEHRVLAALHEGKSNKRIARDLDLCESTVKVHVRHIMRKLGVTNRTQVALLVDRSHGTAPREQGIDVPAHA